MMELAIQDLCKSYDGKTVLKNVSMKIEPGVTALMGPSGVGKTTLVRMLTGLERPDSGEVRIPPSTRFSVVFQEDRLLERLSARENLLFALGENGEAACAFLTAMGLDVASSQPVREYSGGMRRRVALARALGAPFDVLVLDEPFTGLDSENRSRAAALIRRCAAGRVVVLVTHDPLDAAALDATTVILTQC